MDFFSTFTLFRFILVIAFSIIDKAGDIDCAKHEQLALAPNSYTSIEYIVCNDTMVSGENEIALKMWLQIV